MKETMTFDDWWFQYGTSSMRAGVISTHDLAECWQAAQKEAAKRCADLADEHEEGPSARPAIEREFGLDRS